jgi:hypothetical protein
MEARYAERVTPLAAAATALAAFACCVPLGFAGALGVLALSGLFDALQPWFLTAATLLLAVSAVQLYRRRGTCQRGGRRFSLTVLWLSTAIVLLVLLFPQSVAGWIADYVL